MRLALARPLRLRNLSLAARAHTWHFKAPATPDASVPCPSQLSEVACNWLQLQGLVDPQRLCIDGGSAGGYTTLAALAFRRGLLAVFGLLGGRASGSVGGLCAAGSRNSGVRGTAGGSGFQAVASGLLNWLPACQCALCSMRTCHASLSPCFRSLTVHASHAPRPCTGTCFPRAPATTVWLTWSC